MRLRTLVRAALAVLLFVSAASAQLQRKQLPVPNVAGYRALKCDFHMHTVFSDGMVWPVVRVLEAWRGGLDAISITDHDDYHPHDPHVSTDISEPYRLAQARAEELGILLIPGIEITKGEWHFNALFVTDFNATKKLELAAALREAKRQGAFVFWNHPGWKRPEQWFPEIAPLHAEGLFQGFELVNGRTVYAGGFPWMAEKNLAVFANTDIHAPMAESEEDGRPITLVFVRNADSAGVREALAARRTVAWMGGELWGQEALLRGLWEGAVRLETPALSLAQKQRSAALRFRNSSALAFRLRPAGWPAWLSAREIEIKPMQAAAAAVSLSADAPAGEQSLTLDFEVLNCHTAPGKNLVVRLPVRLKRL